MSGPRLTAPAAKLARSISTSSSAAAPQAATLITSSKTAAPLSRKYADLLKERKSKDADHSRHITTRSANRPHPPPREMRLMQTFSSSAAHGAQADTTHIDATVLPSWETLQFRGAEPASELRVPLLPDNFVAQHAPEAVVEPLRMPEISVVAADPETVSVSALTEVEGMTIDGVELKFAHQTQAKEREPGMLTDLWKGLVDDVLGSTPSKGKLAL